MATREKKYCEFCGNGFIPKRSDAKFCKAKCRYDYANRIKKQEKSVSENQLKVQQLQQELEETEEKQKQHLRQKEIDKKNQDKRDSKRLQAEKAFKQLNAASDAQLFLRMVKTKKLSFEKGILEDEYYVKEGALINFSSKNKEALTQKYRSMLREQIEGVVSKNQPSISLDFLLGDPIEKELLEKAEAIRLQITVLQQTKVKLDVPAAKKKIKQVKTSKKSKQERLEALNENRVNVELGGNQVRNMSFDTYALSGELGRFLGNIDKNMVALALTGDSGAGKSYFSYELAKLFLDSGKTVKYFSLEEGIGKLTSNKLEHYGIGNELKITAHASLEDIDEQAEYFDVIIVDSYSKISKDPDDYEILRQSHPNTLFIIIFQKTGNNTPRGGASIVFNSSAVIDVQIKDGHRIATMIKCRYGTQGWVYSITKGVIIQEG